MCWPSKQNMVCIQESINCSVAVIIGEHVVMHILYVKIILSPCVFKKKVLLCNTLFLYKNYIVSQTLRSHHNIKCFVKEFEVLEVPDSVTN